MPFDISLLCIAGLLVGSFLNVIISRFGTDESFVRGRSRCNACRSTIAWYDNVPVLSFILLRGKCRACGEPISWQYPGVELSTAILFAVAGVVFPPSGTAESAFGLVFALGLIGTLSVVFVYDLIHMEIPVSALAFGIIWTVLYLSLSFFFDEPGLPLSVSRLADGIIGGAIAFSLFYGLVFFSKETWMGMGDAWLALILGLVSGWELLLPALTIAFGSGALVGIFLMITGKKGLQSRIPFGPFLAASVIFILFLGTMVGEAFGFG
ncbi:MAG TPA: prepilin peptidase [Candidatus Fimivivens sp.]|nr:prepilin peptidase [Candidatus Fimivivens sp.]